MKQNSKRNMALAIACCSMLISCIDNMYENNLLRQKLKYNAKKFLDELIKVTDAVFEDGKDELAEGSFDQITVMIEFIEQVFSEIPKKSDEEINRFLG